MTDHPTADQAAAATWLQTQAWPLWLRDGVDWQAGAFRESLHPDAPAAPPPGFRRLRVAARQVYVFAQAARAGLPQAQDAVALGLDFLRRRARHAEGGYATLFALDHALLDDSRDLYDLAFVLFGFAHAAGVVADAALAGEARTLMAFIDAEMTHPEGGYREALPDRLPRRQNPHMHLLEAVMAAHAAFGEPLYLDRAEALVDLFLDRMLNHQAAALPEYFDAGLLPVRDPEARFLVEPGHHFEWVWLLDVWRRAAAADGREVRDVDIETASRLLMRTAERNGIDAECGLVLDEIDDYGTIRQRGFRVWPQTERLKAAHRRPDLARTDAATCLGLLQSYFRADRPGLWHERMTPAGPLAGQPAPASSLYHLTCALLESSAI